MPEGTPRLCRHCDTDISDRKHNAVRCAPCAEKRAPWDARPRKRRKMYDHLCEHCAKPFRTRVKRQRYCSQRCSGIDTSPPKQQRICPACGAAYEGNGLGCSRPCYQWARKYPGRPVPTSCGWCTGPIVGRTLGSLYCSRTCAAKTMIQRRRAARNGKPVHQVVPLDVFERDGWVCHLCAEPIGQGGRGKAPGAPALDHIIPVSHPDYPGHIAANLAASHWVCNVAKGNRVTPEDYALYERLLAELPPGEPAKRRPWMGPGPITHCVHGHEFTPENTYWRPDGRQCRKCTKRRATEKYAREDPAAKQARLEALRRSRPNGWSRSRADGDLVLF